MKKLSNLTITVWAFTCLFFVHCYESSGSTQSEQNPVENSGPELLSGKADSTEQESFDTLAAIFQDQNNFNWPPIAKKHGANELEWEAKVMELTEDENGVTQNKTAELVNQLLLDNWGGEEGQPQSLFDLAGGDIHIKFVSGYMDDSLKKYVVQSLAKTEKREEIKKILEEGNYSYQWLQIYDIGAEIVGNELLILSPLSLNKIIVLKIGYVQS